MRLLIMLISISISVGCTTVPKPIAYNCPIITLPPDPIPEVNKLTVKSTPDQIIKAWVITAVQYREWNLIVRKQIKDSQNQIKDNG